MENLTKQSRMYSTTASDEMLKIKNTIDDAINLLGTSNTANSSLELAFL